MSKTKINKNGFTIIETVLSITLASILLISFETLITNSTKISRENMKSIKATIFAREAIEAAKDIELSDWNKFDNPGCISPLFCHPETNSGEWILASGQESLDNGAYTRNITIEPVFRDSASFPNNIVEVGGVLDSDTKKITASVSWQTAYGERKTTLQTYVYKTL